MKKKIVASIAAFALALAMPMAAFAADEFSPQVSGTGADKVQYVDAASVDNVNKIKVVGDVKNGVTATGVETLDAGIQMVRDDISATLAKKLNNEDITKAEKAHLAAQWEVCAVDYENAVNKATKSQGAETISTFVLQGDVKSGNAVVTFWLDNGWAGKTVTYVILHEDGSIQQRTVKVNNDGTIDITMGSFSCVTFISTPAWTPGEETITAGIFGNADAEKAANLASKPGTSPKTGC